MHVSPGLWWFSELREKRTDSEIQSCSYPHQPEHSPGDSLQVTYQAFYNKWAAAGGSFPCKALWIIMCTAGCRHLEDFICLVLVRKILLDANEGASHGTLSKTGLFFNSWSAYITTHCIALHLLMWHKNRWCWYINIQHFPFIQNVWLIHVLLALFVIGYNQNAQLCINNNIAQEYRIRSIFTYQISSEYSFLTGQLRHPAVRCFLIFLVRFLNNIILFINQLIR